MSHCLSPGESFCPAHSGPARSIREAPCTRHPRGGSDEHSLDPRAWSLPSTAARVTELLPHPVELSLHHVEGRAEAVPRQPDQKGFSSQHKPAALVAIRLAPSPARCSPPPQQACSCHFLVILSPALILFSIPPSLFVASLFSSSHCYFLLTDVLYFPSFSYASTPSFLPTS